jgi:hypothetical protein
MSTQQLVLVCLIWGMLASAAGAQEMLAGRELPDAPVPKAASASPPILYRPSNAPHPFFDKNSKVAMGATVGLLAADSAMTCHNLNSTNSAGQHGTENWGPQSCGVMVASMSAWRVGLWGAAYFAHRHGHHRIERMCQWVGPVWNAVGIGTSGY